MKNNVQSKTPGAILFTIFKYIALVTASVVALLPVVVCVLTAFKTNEESGYLSPGPAGIFRIPDKLRGSMEQGRDVYRF